MRARDRGADISGIEADDETGEITIRLTAPGRDVLQRARARLRRPGARRGRRFRTSAPTRPRASGPYEITASEPGREFVLERTPNFADLDIPDIPTGNIDRITTRIVPSVREQAQEVLDGRLDYMQDPPPAGDARATSRAQAKRPLHRARDRLDLLLLPQPAPARRSTTRSSARPSTARSTGARSPTSTGARCSPAARCSPPACRATTRDLDTKRCPYGVRPDPRTCAAPGRSSTRRSRRVNA